MSTRSMALAVVFTAGVSAFGADLKTRDGKVYRQYQVTAVEGDAVRDFA